MTYRTEHFLMSMRSPQMNDARASSRPAPLQYCQRVLGSRWFGLYQILNINGLCLRVLSFTGLYPNNVNPLQGIFIHQRLTHLARLPKTSVEVIAPVPYFPAWLPLKRWKQFSRVCREEKIDGLCVHHPRYPLLSGISMPLHGRLMFLGCVGLARRLHEQISFDCIDAHFVYPDGYAAVLLGRLLGLPVFISARGTDINVYPSYRTIRPMLRWALHQAAGVIAVSSDLGKKIVELGIPAAKVKVISNGVDIERFQPQDLQKSRLRLELAQDVPLIVSVGSLIESKGHHLLIDAISELTAWLPQLRLYILGEGVYRSKLQQRIREKNLQDRAFLMGNRPNEELSAWFSAANLSCVMSSREGWPNVVSESLACGTPVLATRVGGIPEILVSPDLGVMVERDVPSIAKGLEQALGTSWNRVAIANQARTRSWDTVAEEVAAFFRAKM
jgi:glycosyltransferase involved in cell wall biosynthesis